MPLQASALHFSFSSQPVLNGLHLTLADQKKVALTGPNGCGKSTLLKILAGQLAPDEGHVSGEAYLLAQHLVDERPLSGGEARMEALRKAFDSHAGTILLDEPTNDLDDDARAWLGEQIFSTSSALLMVSHDPMILDLVDEIWELRNGVILKHPGGYAGFLARLEREEAGLRDEIKSIRAQARRMDAKAREIAEGQRKRMSRGENQGRKENLPKIIRGAKKRQAEVTLARAVRSQENKKEEMQARLEAVQARLREISLFEWDSEATKPPEGKRMLELKDVRLPHFSRGVNLSVSGPRRVLLRGKNGAGKSTILKALAGDQEAKERLRGELYLAPPFRLFDQALSQFASDQPLWEWFQENTGLEIAFARSVLGRLGFEQEEQLRPLSALSGGERVRLEIALALHAVAPPQILLLDEPTNHLDVESRRILVDFVKKFRGAILVVSHDAAFTGELKFDETLDLDECRKR